MEKIYFQGIEVIQAEYNNKWKVSDTRRIIFFVKFKNGTIWFPRDDEIEMIKQSKQKCFEHNIQYPNLDNEQKNLVENGR